MSGAAADSTQQWEAYQAALKNGPNTPGAFNNKYGFDEYALHAQVDYRDEVNGVLVGYAGHVPRARDKVGGCPIGHTPGTPASPIGPVGINMETGIRELPADREEKFMQMYTKGGDVPNKYTAGMTSANYTSEARDPQNKSNTMRPKMFAQGTTPGYTGHVPKVKTHSLGATTHSTPPPGSSMFVGKWAATHSPQIILDIKMRRNKAGHHAVSGQYMLATVNNGELLVAIDEAAGEILVDFSSMGGPKDLPGKWTDGAINFANGLRWEKYKPPTTFDTGFQM